MCVSFRRYEHARAITIVSVRMHGEQWQTCAHHVHKAEVDTCIARYRGECVRGMHNKRKA